MKIKNIEDINRPYGTVVFITGCTGQDGSLMIDYLLRETSHSIIGGARRLSIENHDNIRHLEHEPRFQLVNFDLTDSHSIYKIIEHIQPDYFINFAAQSFVASSWDFARQTWQCNSTGVLDCLAAIKHSKPDCRFYNAGSSEEFGNVVYSPQDEKHPSRPRSPYGASKCAARTLVKVYRESYGMYAVQGWLFNHEGPRRGEEFVTRKISKAVASIAKSGLYKTPIIPIELGNLSATRDWSDAEDMMDAIWRMLNQEIYNKNLNKEHFDEWHELYNETHNKKQITEWESKRIKDYVVSSDENHTIREFVEKSFRLVGITGTWIGEGLDEKYKDSNGNILVKVNPKFYRPAEVDILCGNSSAIRRELGWKPKTSFDKLIEKMVGNDFNPS